MQIVRYRSLLTLLVAAGCSSGEPSSTGRALALRTCAYGGQSYASGCGSGSDAGIADAGPGSDGGFDAGPDASPDGSLDARSGSGSADAAVDGGRGSGGGGSDAGGVGDGGAGSDGGAHGDGGADGDGGGSGSGSSDAGAPNDGGGSDGGAGSGGDAGGSDGPCGDGTCSAGETCDSCPDDCGACPACGDGSCTAGETCDSCPGDCGDCPPPQCAGSDLEDCENVLQVFEEMTADDRPDPTCTAVAQWLTADHWDPYGLYIDGYVLESFQYEEESVGPDEIRSSLFDGTLVSFTMTNVDSGATVCSFVSSWDEPIKDKWGVETPPLTPEDNSPEADDPCDNGWQDDLWGCEWEEDMLLDAAGGIPPTDTTDGDGS